MRNWVIGRVWLGLAWAWVPATSGYGGDGAAPPDRPSDLAVQAMRREAEAAAAARERAFQRLAALPVPPPVVERFQANRGLIRLVEAGPAPGAFLVRRIDPPDDSGEHDPGAGAEPRYEVAEESFDLFLLGTTGDAESVRTYFAALLDRRLDAVERGQGLTAAQRRKLLLAGRGDIKRLFDRIEEARATFRSLRTDVERCADFLAGLLPLSRELRRGPFGDESLLEKTLRTTRAQALAAGGPAP